MDSSSPFGDFNINPTFRKSLLNNNSIANIKSPMPINKSDRFVEIYTGMDIISLTYPNIMQSIPFPKKPPIIKENET